MTSIPYEDAPRPAAGRCTPASASVDRAVPAPTGRPSPPCACFASAGRSTSRGPSTWRRARRSSWETTSPLMDPVVAVMAHWWRVTAFTKVEVYEKRGGIFFRLMGQIPLRRGDNDSTAWAMDMATRTLADGNKVGLYPEGTRSPDGRTMHRLHRRVLIPMLEANPDVAVHAITTTYPTGGRLRRRAVVRISPRLDIDTRTMAPAHVMDVMREALISTGRSHLRRHVRAGGEGGTDVRTPAHDHALRTDAERVPALPATPSTPSSSPGWPSRDEGIVALRIDDMDAARYRPEYVRDIFVTLEWLGITWQRGPRGRGGLRARITPCVAARTTTGQSCRRQATAASGCTHAGARAASSSDHPSEAARAAVATPATSSRSARRHSGPASRLDACPEIGDVVLWRRDDLPAYHLASVIEDRDLGCHSRRSGRRPACRRPRSSSSSRPTSTRRPSPRRRIVHHELLTDAHGAKLSKSTRATVDRCAGQRTSATR